MVLIKLDVFVISWFWEKMVSLEIDKVLVFFFFVFGLKYIVVFFCIFRELYL